MQGRNEAWLRNRLCEERLSARNGHMLQARLHPLLQLNHNVLFTFIYRFSDGIAQGVWSAASMATYIYLLEHKSTKVSSSLLKRDTSCTNIVP